MNSAQLAEIQSRVQKIIDRQHVINQCVSAHRKNMLILRSAIESQLPEMRGTVLSRLSLHDLVLKVTYPDAEVRASQFDALFSSVAVEEKIHSLAGSDWHKHLTPQALSLLLPLLNVWVTSLAATPVAAATRRAHSVAQILVVAPSMFKEVFLGDSVRTRSLLNAFLCLLDNIKDGRTSLGLPTELLLAVISSLRMVATL